MKQVLMFKKILIANRGDKAGGVAAQPNGMSALGARQASSPREP
jgi:hypothetical protein